MEIFVMACENLWIIMILYAFFVCLKKGWLRKGFYLTGDQADEAEYKEAQKKTETTRGIRDRAALLHRKALQEEKNF